MFWPDYKSEERGSRVTQVEPDVVRAGSNFKENERTQGGRSHRSNTTQLKLKMRNQHKSLID